MSLPVRFSGKQPLVVQLEAQIRRLIEQGQLPAGARVPSVRQLARDLEISPFTAVTAYDRLVAADYLYTRKAAGHFVAKRRLDHMADPQLRSGGTLDALWLFNALAAHPQAVKAGAGVLPAHWLASDDVQRCARTALRGSARSHTNYPGPMGWRPLRDLLALKLIDLGISAQADQVLLTAGASQAVDLAMRTLVSPGDTVLVEDPGYYALRAYLDAEGIAWAAVPRSGDGLDLDALDAAMQMHRPKVLVANSVLHNPTGGTLGTINAHGVLSLAERHDVTIVEDDIYGDFYAGRAFRLANLDQLRRVVYVSSFSKTLSPSWRTGFLAAAAPLVRRMAERKLLTCLASNELSERIVAEVMASGVYRRHVERLRHRLADTTPTVVAALVAVGLTVPTEPEGGFFLWARLDSDRTAEEWAADALSHGLVLAPGSIFSASSSTSRHLRFNVAHCDGSDFPERLGRCGLLGSLKASPPADADVRGSANAKSGNVWVALQGLASRSSD